METSRPVGVYLNQKSKTKFRNDNGGSRNSAGENNGGQKFGGGKSQPGNFTREFGGRCFLCDGVGHERVNVLKQTKSINLQKEMQTMSIR